MLTRKEISAQKRKEKVDELMKYFLQAYEAIRGQYPKDAFASALERTEAILHRWSKNSPQEKSFFVDVKIEFRSTLKTRFGMNYGT